MGGFGGPGGGAGGMGRGARGFGARASGRFNFQGGAGGFGGGRSQGAPPAGAPTPGSAGAAASAGSAGGVGSLFQGGSGSGSGTPRLGFGGGLGGAAGAPGAGGRGMFGGDSSSLEAAARYAKSHGGGTVAIESQASAAMAIIDSNADVAGIGGFSGRESTVSAQWLAMEVRQGKLRWVLAQSGAGAGGAPGGFAGRGGLGGDGRQGSASAFEIAAKVGRKATFTSNGTTVTMYDLQGKAAAILAAADGG
jgi:hypothetical protein